MDNSMEDNIRVELGVLKSILKSCCDCVDEGLNFFNVNEEEINQPEGR